MPVSYRKTVKPLTGYPVNFIPSQLDNRLGSGLAIPLEVITNRWSLLKGQEKIRQDIYVTLATPIGSHLLQPDFGSLLPYLLFELWGPTLEQELSIATKTALKTWVPAILVQDVKIGDEEIENNVVLIEITYLIKGTLATQSITIALVQDDTVQLPPEIFTIGGNQVMLGAALR